MQATEKASFKRNRVVVGGQGGGREKDAVAVVLAA